MDIQKILEYQRQFVKEREWDQFHTPKNLSMALCGEAGELLEVFQWLTESQSQKVMQDEKTAMAVRNEAADVFFYLMRLCDQLGIDLEKAFWEKTRQNEAKYPVDRSRGHAKKYTEI